MRPRLIRLRQQERAGIVADGERLRELIGTAMSFALLGEDGLDVSDPELVRRCASHRLPIKRLSA